MNCQQTLHERRQPPVRLAPGEVPAHPIVGIGEITHARAAVLDGRQYPCADQFRQADLVDLRAEAAWGSFSNTATWLWLRRVRLCFELGALQARCWGRLLAALANAG